MEINHNKVSVEALTSALLARKTTRHAFRWPISFDQAHTLLTAAYIAEVQYRRREYTETQNLRNAISQIVGHLVGDSHRFGLMLCGLPGNGKTTMLYAIRSANAYLNHGNISVTIIDAKDYARRCKDITWTDSAKAMPVLALEDIGREPMEVVDFGNIINPIVDCFEYRYNEQLPTIITTNLTPAELREKYGARIADRFNEMMNVVVFNDESFRQ